MHERTKSALTVGIVPPLLATALASLTIPVAAQNPNETNARDYVCMAHSRSQPGEKATRIVAPRPSVEVLEAKGFVEFDCDREGFPLAQQVKFRDEICAIAADQPEGMQQQLEAVFGERPAILCGMAEVALGQWDDREVQK